MQDQVRYNYNDKGRQVSLYLGQASNVQEARQIFIERGDDIDLLISGALYFGNKVISC